jgi:hypothetical protein
VVFVYVCYAKGGVFGTDSGVDVWRRGEVAVLVVQPAQLVCGHFGLFDMELLIDFAPGHEKDTDGAAGDDVDDILKVAWGKGSQIGDVGGLGADLVRFEGVFRFVFGDDSLLLE